MRTSRTIRILGEEYLKDSIERGKQPRTMEQRESRLREHINPTIGDVPVARWRVEHSRKVMEKGAKALFPARGREDLRGQLAAMRKLAWRLGWLDRSIDPLDGLEIGKVDVLHGATTQYVDPRLRPETRQVKAMADAADTLCGPDGTDRSSPGSPSSARRSAWPASAACASASRTPCGRSMCSSSTVRSISTARGSPQVERLRSVGR